MMFDFVRVIQFLQALIRIESLPGREKSLIDRVAAEMNALGYDQVFTDTNGSLIGLIEGPQSGPTLLGQAIMALTDIISDPYPGYSVIPSRCREHATGVSHRNSLFDRMRDTRRCRQTCYSS